MRRAIAILSLVGLLGVPAAARADHDTPYEHGEDARPALNGAMSGVAPPEFVDGPCTDDARRAMPAGDDHDHLDVTQHDFTCRMARKYFDPLKGVLGARPDVVLGEMDIEGGLMAIGVAYPESGFLLYDISHPASPRLLSWYRGEECEQLLQDVDCGAYVDVSETGERVYLSVQQTTLLPSPSAATRPVAAYPGVEVVDISDPTLPVAIQAQPVLSEGGVHTTNSFVVPGDGGEGPREPGEFLVSVANSLGLAIHEVLPTGHIAPVSFIEIGETHDTFVQHDRILDRTLLYAAGGFTTGFYVWDVTAPSDPVPLGEWDPTPECEDDWYAHTIDVRVKGGKRVLTMPNELFDHYGPQDDESCGTVQGNGDLAGPMWFVDITDLDRLPSFDSAPPADDTREPEEEVKRKSLALLSSFWSNAAGRAAGGLTFSPHNQQIVGDKVYLSQYHGGVVVLDAGAALEGRNVRPREIGLYVPHDGPERPIRDDEGGILQHFFTGFLDYRPLIWDTLYSNGHVFIPDMTGGLTVVREEGSSPSRPGPPLYQPGCKDRRRPVARISAVRVGRRAVRLRGRAADRGCSGVSRVSVAVARRVGRRCAFLSSSRRFSRPRSCRRPIFLGARGTRHWSYRARTRTRRGSYLVLARATDASGNRGRVVRSRTRRP